MRKLKNLAMYNDLKNKVAIIAGANGSIGNAIANLIFQIPRFHSLNLYFPK